MKMIIYGEEILTKFAKILRENRRLMLTAVSRCLGKHRQRSTGAYTCCRVNRSKVWLRRNTPRGVLRHTFDDHEAVRSSGVDTHRYFSFDASVIRPLGTAAVFGQVISLPPLPPPELFFWFRILEN